jgi:transposase
MEKKKTKARTKHYVKYGYSIPEMAELTGLGVATIHKYLHCPTRRKLLLADLKRIVEKKKKKENN